MQPPEQPLLETFQTGRELSKLVPGFRVELMVVPVPRFSITGGEIDDKKKKISINLWEGATRKDALAILAHEYAHIKPGTTEIERGLSEVDAWARGFEYAKKWGAPDAYLEHARGLANYYEQRKMYPRIASGIREWLSRKGGSMDEKEAERIAERAAVKASELTAAKLMKEFKKEGGNPVSEKCARVIEELETGKVPCWDFRETRRAAACFSWREMEEKHVPWSVGIKAGWDAVRRLCTWKA